MSIEVELKAWVDDPAECETGLRKQATFITDTHKLDVYFRRADAQPGEHFRLRCEDDTFTVTVKHRRIVEGMEINDEVDFEVSDPHTFCRFADGFGFEPFVVKRKHSRVYRAGRVNLELNEVEHLGHFIEVEILCEDASQVETARKELAGWAGRLNIQQKAIEPKPYTTLLRERHAARYTFAHDDPDALVHEEPLDNAGCQARLL